MSIHPQAERIAPKIKYEWNMLQYCHSRISDEWTNADLSKRNLLLEDFLLHARVLRDFFVGRPRQDDASAAHFFENAAVWESIAVNFCAYLRQHKQRLDKYLAHLTYSRLNEDKNWDVNIIYNELVQARQQFYSLLPQVRQEWFD